MKFSQNKFLKYGSLFLFILDIFSMTCIGYNLVDKRTTSMKEAFHLAYEAVSNENNQALLLHMSSTDSVKKTENKNAGKNGQRRYWNMIFAVPNSNENWIITIRDHKIKDMVKVTGNYYNKGDLIDQEELFIDSKEALRIAKKEYDLRPGDIWAIGYHFILDKADGNVIISVFGRDSSDNFARIFINIKTKKIVDAIHKIPIGDGTYQWQELK